jgi:hypothetical protein
VGCPSVVDGETDSNCHNDENDCESVVAGDEAENDFGSKTDSASDERNDNDVPLAWENVSDVDSGSGCGYGYGYGFPASGTQTSLKLNHSSHSHNLHSNI